jgi:hypothetical protein
MNSIDVLDSFLKHAELAAGSTQETAPENNLISPQIHNAQPLKRMPISSSPVSPGGNTTTSGAAPKPLTDLKNPKIK